MTVNFRFPDVGEGIQEGEIVKWKVKEGDAVKADQILVEVETDKAVVEVPSPEAGTVLKIHHKAGEVVKVGEVLVSIGKKGDKVKVEKRIEKKETKRKSSSVVGELEEAEEETHAPVKIQKKAKRKIVLATPKVRALAKKLNIDIEKVEGSGRKGRVQEKDLHAGAPTGIKPRGVTVKKKYDKYGYLERISLTGIRRTIANKLTESFPQAHVTHMDEADITELIKVKDKEKKRAAKQGVKLTLGPFLVKATIAALKKHPYLNSSLEGEEIIIKKYYNIGVATDTADGLMVPVIKIAEGKNILELAKDITNLVKKAKSRKIDIMDLQGSTFSITNIGSLGGMWFTPIMNPGNSAILGTGRAYEKVVMIKNKARTRTILPLSVTFDHRVVDGAEVARFTNDLKAYLEDPNLLVLEN